VQEQPFAISTEKRKGPNPLRSEMTSTNSKDISIAPMVPLYEIEEQVPWIHSPGSQSGMQARNRQRKDSEGRVLTKKDSFVATRIRSIQRKNLEVQVGPAGKPLDHEE